MKKQLRSIYKHRQKVQVSIQLVQRNQIRKLQGQHRPAFILKQIKLKLHSLIHKLNFIPGISVLKHNSKKLRIQLFRQR